MSKSKKELNPKLVKGDRIMCLHMDGETGVPMGTTGTVRSSTKTRLNLIVRLLMLIGITAQLWVYYL